MTKLWLKKLIPFHQPKTKSPHDTPKTTSTVDIPHSADSPFLKPSLTPSPNIDEERRGRNRKTFSKQVADTVKSVEWPFKARPKSVAAVFTLRNPFSKSSANLPQRRVSKSMSNLKKRPVSDVSPTILATPPSVELVGRNPEVPKLLTTSMALKLQKHLTCRLRWAPVWKLLYSLNQHGTSLHTLYSKVNNMGPCLLVVKTVKGEIFGAVVSDPFRPHPSYYGNGECFLWKYCPISHSVKEFKWTGGNDFNIMCEGNYLSVGGGNGTYGLWLDSDLFHGFSDHCPTFGNEPLSAERDFECVGVEVWGFQGD